MSQATGLENIDIQGIATALGLSRRAVEKRAQKECWPRQSIPSRGRNGTKSVYQASSLPADVAAAVVMAYAHAQLTNVKFEAPTSGPTSRQAAKLSPEQVTAAWQRYEAAPQHIKDTAQQRLRALQAVDALVNSGRSLMDARELVAVQLQREGVRGGSVASLCRWAKEANVAEVQHRLALLVPSYSGGTASAEIPAEAWDLYKADYLRLEAPSASSCYDRLARIAKVNGWVIPTRKTFERRIKAEFNRATLLLAREGMEALNRSFPAQERDRSVFHALEAVNADGHKFDVFVRWPDGTIGRPIMVGVQDLYSGKLLGYRVAETESADLARFAFRDVIQTYGIPTHIWLDNGRAFASKLLTGGTANRFRFKVKADDPVGILTNLGCDIRWATPYHGQAKPIERAWRDLCDRIAKHPALAGAYTGNKPDAKPENYGSKAVPADDFMAVLHAEIAAHNAREGRRTRICAGQHSFDQAFNQSYATSPIRRATEEQLRHLLLATDVVSTDSRDGSVRLSGNRYWCAALGAHAGRKVQLKFDPMSLHTSVEAYTLANVHIGTADCIAAVGFADTNAAREHARAKRNYRKAAQDQLNAERRMDAASMAAQLPGPMPDALPAPGVVAPLFNLKGQRATPRPLDEEPQQRTGTDDNVAAFGSLMERLAARNASTNPLWKTNPGSGDGDGQD